MFDPSHQNAAPGRTLNPPVFFVSAGSLLVLLTFGVLASDTAHELFPRLLQDLGRSLGWFYVLAVTGFLGLCVWLSFSRYGALRLGRDDERPEFGDLTWCAMLFSAGMGIGLVFNGVAEPILHFASPPVGEGGTPDAAARALPLTLLHWGVHAWSIYTVVALALAYFAFRHRLPLTLRSCFYPLLGERVHGWPGHVVDILAVISTLFGLACSLGLGAMQVSAGLEHLFGVPHGTATQLVIIAVITSMATVSLVTGVKKGIRRLSELNVVLAMTLLLLVAVLGPTRDIIALGIQSVGAYLADLPARTLYLGALDDEAGGWVTRWTVVYWGWWIAWAPFVGMFVARISRGRTVRQLVVGSLWVPTGMTAVWFVVFGGTALHLELTADAGIAAAATHDVATAIYAMLEHLPAAGLSCLLAVAVVTIFFVTSSDSASLVVDMLTSGGHPNPPVWQRIFWATAEGLTAAVLLYAGGSAALEGLQAAVVSMGLPFCCALVGVCASLVVALRREEQGLPLRDGARAPAREQPHRTAGDQPHRAAADILS